MLVPITRSTGPGASLARYASAFWTRSISVVTGSLPRSFAMSATVFPT